MILLIDDKKPIQNEYCWEKFNRGYKTEISKLIEFTDLSNFSDYFDKDGPVLLPKFDIQKYDWIFFHNSFDDALLNSGQIDSLRQFFKERIIGFSGDRDNKKNTIINFKCKNITSDKKLYREYFFKNLKLFVNWEIISGDYEIGVFTKENGIEYLTQLAKDIFLVSKKCDSFFLIINNLLDLLEFSNELKKNLLNEFQQSNDDMIINKIDHLYIQELKHYK